MHFVAMIFGIWCLIVGVIYTIVGAINPEDVEWWGILLVLFIPSFALTLAFFLIRYAVG